MEILEDNQSAICLANNPVFHVELKYHFIRDHVGGKCYLDILPI